MEDNAQCDAFNTNAIFLLFISLMSKMPLPGRRGTRWDGAGKSTAVKDFAHYSVEAVQDAAAAGKEGDKGRRRREGGEQGVAV